jgi:hypothetical protein
MHFNALIYTYQFYIGQFACRDVSTGATGATYSHQEEQIQPTIGEVEPKLSPWLRPWFLFFCIISF